MFGDRAFRKIIKVDWGPKDGVLIWWDLCPYEKEKTLENSVFHPGHREKAIWEHREKVAVWKPRREKPEANRGSTDLGLIAARKNISVV